MTREDKILVWTGIRTLLLGGFAVGGIIFYAIEAIKLGLILVALPMLFGAAQLLWINCTKLINVIEKEEA